MRLIVDLIEPKEIQQRLQIPYQTSMKVIKRDASSAGEVARQVKAKLALMFYAQSANSDQALHGVVEESTPQWNADGKLCLEFDWATIKDLSCFKSMKQHFIVEVEVLKEGDVQ